MKKLRNIKLLVLLIFCIILAGCNLHMHNFSQRIIEPTCENKGYTEFVCECGMIAKNDFVAPLGHSYSEWTIIKEATEEECGVQERRCLTCQKIESEEIAKLEHVHVYEEKVVEPTCIKSGYTEYTCYCGYVYQDNFKNYLGHDYSEWVITKEPTEIEAGKQEKVCSRCSEKIVLDIPEIDHEHEYTITQVEVSCEENGYTEYKCRCGYLYQDNIIEKIGHNYSDWETINEPTDLVEGLKERTCANCNNKDTESIPKLAHTHSYVKSIILPTCTEEGYTLYKCACNDEYKEEVVNPLGHSSDYTVIKKSEYFAPGLIEYNCKNCDYKETKDLNYFACSHNYLEVDNYDNAPNAPGFKAFKCEFCTDTKSSVINASNEVKQPNISLTEYSLDVIKQAVNYTKDIFESTIKNNQKELFIHPYMSLSEYKTVKDFTLDLVKDCKDEKEKTRKIYEWIVNNLDYDVSAYSQSIYQTFLNKKAVCFGYVSLLHDMLSSVGIMSSYISGYTSYSTLTYNDIFNHINNQNSHAWLYAYVNNEILIMDPTWADGYHDLNYGFDMNINKMYLTHLVMTVDEINIIPNNIDYRLYTNLFYNFDEYMVYMKNGKVEPDINLIKIRRNNSVDIIFVSNRNKYTIYNEKDIVGCIVKHGFYCSDIAKQSLMDNWTYSLVNGITYQIQDVMNYIKLLNNDYGYNIILDLPEPVKKYYG